MGVKRARIVRELDGETPYRMAEIELLEEVRHCSSPQLESLRQQVTVEFRRMVSRRPLADEESLDHLLGQDLPLGQLVDLIGYSCGADLVDQQMILNELDVERRADIVLDLLRRQQTDESKLRPENHTDFPPDFSVN